MAQGVTDLGRLGCPSDRLGLGLPAYYVPGPFFATSSYANQRKRLELTRGY